MKKAVLRSLSTFFFSLFILRIASAQLVVGTVATPEELAAKLVGGGVTISNITLTCSAGGWGDFDGTSSNLAMDSGIILASGSINNAVGPNLSSGITTDFYAAGDQDLTDISGFQTFDACVLEFDLQTTGDTVRFDYVFGSDEYTEWVYSSFNDIFAFLISGPGILGEVNIALEPGTGVPVSINNVNCLNNSIYYVCNDPFNYECAASYNCPTDPNATSIEYDGFTKVLTAQSVVQPCQTYHLKLAIADAGDPVLDSGVFLKAGSLTSSGTSVSAESPYVDPTIGQLAIVEGCFPGSFNFTITNPPVDTTYIHYTIGGTALEGTDYSDLPDSLQILPGETSATLDMDAFVDGLTEGGETIVIYLYLPCSSEPYDSAVIYIFDEMDVVAGPDTSICIGQSVQLYSTGGIGIGTWLWVPGVGLSCTTCEDPIATPLATTDYIVSVTIGNCTVKDTVHIDVDNPLPVNAGPDASICLDDSWEINATNANTYSWTPSTGLSCDDCPNPVASPSTTTTYIVTGINGCFTTSDTITITVNPSVDALADGDTTICPDQSVQLTSSGGTTYSWSPQTGLDDSEIQNPIATCSSTTTYTVLVANQFGCTDTASVTIEVYDIPDVTVSDDTTIYLGNSVDLEVTGGISYSWDPPTYLSDPTSANPTSVQPGDTITYYVTVTSDFGCVNIDSVTIYVKWDALVQIPSAFSPNNDGRNDWLHPLVRGIFTLDHLKVYNRWGELVFAMNDLSSPGWDGEFKGEPQPVGVYIFELAGKDYVGNAIQKQGNITLVR